MFLCFPLAQILRGRTGGEAAATALIAQGGAGSGPLDRLARSDDAPPAALAGLRTAPWRVTPAGVAAVLPDGKIAELTLDPRLQGATERLLQGSHAAYSAAVVLSVDDGRVLAMAGQSTREPATGSVELTLKPWAPAASIFKLVTTAALLEAGVSAERRVCYHDGIHSVEASNLTSHPRWDTACQSLEFGLAKSNNAIVGRLANDHLTPEILGRMARSLGFGAPLRFELPVEPSAADLPADNGLSFARVAAGFWSTTISPLHAAVLAATIARGGTTPPVHLVDRITTPDGAVLRPATAEPVQVLSQGTAAEIGRMMVGTTSYGTARGGFRDRRTNRPLLPFSVAGKTGTLNRKEPFLGYSWFVGFAPAERPEIAFAVLLGNGEGGGLRAHQVARELVAAQLIGAEAPSSSVRIASR